MMIRSRVSLFASILALVFLTVGCEEGPVGPPGPPGPQGPAGVAVSSFDVFFDVQSAQTGPNGLVLFSNYDAPEITSNVLTNGLVMCYYFESNNTLTAMPYTYGEDQSSVGEYTLTFGFAFDVDLVQIFYEGSKPSALDFAVDRDVRVVVMEGDPFTSASKAASAEGVSKLDALQEAYPEVDWADYYDVAEHFDLPMTPPSPRN